MCVLFLLNSILKVLDLFFTRYKYNTKLCGIISGNRPVCRHFKSGGCRRGAQCGFLHPGINGPMVPMDGPMDGPHHQGMGGPPMMGGPPHGMGGPPGMDGPPS